MEITQAVMNVVESRIPEVIRQLGIYVEEHEDIVQDVYIRLMELDASFDEELVGRTVWSVANNFRTKEQRRAELFEERIDQLGWATGGDDDTADPLEYLEAEELVRVFEGMTPLLRQIVQGLYIDNKSVPALAKELDMAPNALYQNVNRIKQILKENGYGG